MTLCTIVQARMGSTRLPGKVLKKVGGKTILEHVLHRIELCPADTGTVVVATSVLSRDNPIEKLCDHLGIYCFRGSERDVLNRYRRAAELFEADVVLRVTADEPLLCPQLTARILDYPAGPDYVTCENVPLGLTGELVTLEALERCWLGSDAEEREHVTLRMLNHPATFEMVFLRADSYLFDRRDWRLTLDTEEDLELLERLYLLTNGELFEMATPEIVGEVERNKKAHRLVTRQA